MRDALHSKGLVCFCVVLMRFLYVSACVYNACTLNLQLNNVILLSALCVFVITISFLRVVINKIQCVFTSCKLRAMGEEWARTRLYFLCLVTLQGSADVTLLRDRIRNTHNEHVLLFWIRQQLLETHCKHESQSTRASF